MATARKTSAAPPIGLPSESLFTTRQIAYPVVRPLQVYAFDPSAGRLIGNFMQTVLRYEKLKPGPVGTRFAVVDYDGAHQCYYEPVDLDDPKILIRGGLEPSQSDP